MARRRKHESRLRSLLVMGALAALAAAASADSLVPERPIERQLAAAQSHVYEVERRDARPWLVTVEQLGVDVTVAVGVEDDGFHAAVDSPLDRRGGELLLVESPAPGRARPAVYRVTIRAREPGAPAGRYRLRLDEPGGALEAARATSRAGELYLRGTADAWRAAIPLYRRAHDLWRSLGDDRAAARALYAAAVLHRLVDETAPALAAGRQALELWQALGERFWEANTLNELGLGAWRTGDGDGARDLFARARALHRAAGERYGEAVAHANLCLMDLVAGELRAGRACYLEALPLLREVRAAALESTAQSNLARAYDVLGEPHEALGHYREALARTRSIGDRMGEAHALNNLAVLSRELGDYEDALRRYDEALAIFRDLDQRRWQARVLSNVGLVYFFLGETRRALAHFEDALARWREVGDARGEASTLTNLGRVHDQLGDGAAALGFHRRALELRRAAGDARGEGIALTNLGRARMAAGDPTAALVSLGRAVELLRAVGDRPNEVNALILAGRALTSLDRPADALAPLERALELARAVGYRTREASALEALAEAARRLQRPEQARAHVEQALDVIESVRTRIHGPDLRASYLGMQHRAYELDVDLAMAAGDAAAALEASERARARALVELLAEARADVREGVDGELLGRRESLEQRLHAKAERVLGDLADAERAALEAELLALRRELDVVEAEIREESPGYAALVRPRPLTAAQARGLLDPDVLLLSYFLGERRSFLWAVTADGVDGYELPARQEIAAAVRRLHGRLAAFDAADRRGQWQAAAALGRLLLGPVAARLEGRRLVIVPDGALHYLPFAALPLPADAAEPLVERHQVVYLPSATALAVQRRAVAGRPPAAGALAVLADPVFDRRDPRVGRDPGAAAPPRFERLPASRAEAEAVAALAPGPVLMALGFDASRPRALGEGLRPYRAVHFATHGVIDAEQPALSGLALSMVDAEGRPRKGFLSLTDVYNLRLDADLVVLSGCRTALGKEIRGEGMIGLVRGFYYAGAPRVVASLWSVEDRATAALMTSFYRALWQQGRRPAAALRAAQRAVKSERRWRDPYFWAGFVLAGEWR